MTKLNLRHLEAFVAIANAGNFTRAAQALHVSQPALTVQIRQLEETIGVRLLDRNTRTVKLTKIGQQLSPVVQRLLGEIEAVVLHAHDLEAGIRGIVSIAGLPSVCSTILPRIIVEFRKDNPGITVTLKDVLARQALSMVKNDEVDFAIGSFAGGDPAVHVQPLFQDQMLAVFSPAFALPHKGSVKLKELVALPLVLPVPQSSIRTLLDRAFESIGRFPTPAYETTHVPSAMGIVKAGLGLTFVPSLMLELFQLEGLESRVVSHPGLTRNIVAVHRSGRQLSSAAIRFLKALTDGCANVPNIRLDRMAFQPRSTDLEIVRSGFQAIHEASDAQIDRQRRKQAVLSQVQKHPRFSAAAAEVVIEISEKTSEVSSGEHASGGHDIDTPFRQPK